MFILLAGERTWRWRWGTDVNGGMWNPILGGFNKVLINNQCNYNKWCHQNQTESPDVLVVVDFILLQNAPPYFHHPLHWRNKRKERNLVTSDIETQLGGFCVAQLWVVTKVYEAENLGDTVLCGGSQVLPVLRCFHTHGCARVAHPEGCVASAASCSCRCASWLPPANDARRRVWRHENTAARDPVDGNDETTIILRQEERATLTLNRISVSVCLLAIWQNGQSSSSEASWVAIGVVGFGYLSAETGKINADQGVTGRRTTNRWPSASIHDRLGVNTGADSKIWI